jgi:hypothetical protein
MHAALKSQLETIATAALQQPAGPPRVTSFLDALGPIHRDWHSVPPSARAYGFLLFHAEVMHLLASVDGPAFFGGIPPYTLADFRRFGRPFNVTYRVPRGSVSAMSTYSVDVEDWHNRAHMAIEMATHLNMMDPLTNVKLREFWRLHAFIQARFETRLRTFRRVAGQTAADTIAEIETADHAAVPTI